MASLKLPVTHEDHIQGSETAPVSLVEYGDYECPHCAHAYSVIKRVQKHFGKKLSFVYRNFPLNQIHPQAESAAETAEFAGAQGKFWAMHDRLFENQERLGEELYSELAEELSLSSTELLQALEEGKYTSRVRADFSGGVRSGVNGTPTFFINGIRHDGPPDYESIVLAIQERLTEPRSSASA